MGAVNMTAPWLGLGTGIAQTAIGIQERKNAKKQQAEAIALQRQKLQFANDIYQDWVKTFGPINKELASHFASLSTQQVIDRYQMAGDSAINDFKAQVTKQNQEMQRTFARQGMSDSGTAAAMSNSLAMDAAEKEAAMRRGTTLAQLNADREVAQEKMQWANMGAQQKGQVLGLMSNSYDSLAGTTMGAAQTNLASAENLISSGIKTSFGALGQMAENHNKRLEMIGKVFNGVLGGM